MPSADKGKAKEVDPASEAAAAAAEEKGKWEASKEARERGLRERKERMILEARRYVPFSALHAMREFVRSADEVLQTDVGEAGSSRVITVTREDASCPISTALQAAHNRDGLVSRGHPCRSSFKRNSRGSNWATASSLTFATANLCHKH